MPTARAGAALAVLLVAALGCHRSPGGALGGAPRGAPEPAPRRRGGTEELVTRAPLADVLARHTPELLKLPGVNGTGEGVDANQPVLVVFVTENGPALRARLPRTIEGYRVLVRETGTVRAR